MVAHIDIRGVTTALDGETLTVTFQLRDLPEALTFNRTGVPAGFDKARISLSFSRGNSPCSETLWSPDSHFSPLPARPYRQSRRRHRNYRVRWTAPQLFQNRMKSKISHEHALEYNWEVSIDVDHDPATGSGGFDYMLSAGYFVHPLARNSETVAEITQPGFVKASLWGLNRQGYRVLAEADIAVEVSAEENTITLSGEIPGDHGRVAAQAPGV